jgi:hypothetical protein
MFTTARRTITPSDGGGAMADAVTLQVRYVKAYTQDKSRITAVRKIRIDRSWNIRKALTLLATEGRMTHMDDKYLYLPSKATSSTASTGGSSSAKVFGTWLHPDKTFADYNIKDMVPPELIF